MSMFKKEEAFNIVKNFFKVEDAEQRMETNRRALLDEIILNIQSRMPFQNVSLLSQPPEQRRKPTRDEMKTNFISGIGGLCCDLNIVTFELMSALGFDTSIVGSTVSSSVIGSNNHIVLFINSLEKAGDQFLVDAAVGHPTFQAISLDFEEESPVFINSYLEYKYVKHEGKLLRMQRKGDSLASRGPQKNSELEFWLGDWRRFYSTDLAGTKDPLAFEKYHKMVYENPEFTPFHKSHRVVIFRNGKLSAVVNEKLLNENDKGELVTTALNGDEEIIAAMKKVCPALPDEMLQNSIKHWRHTTS